MGALETLLLALGLSMDAMAVAIASGAARKDFLPREAARMALFFGGFQFLMPLLGWAGGEALRGFIAGIDHWVAFGLLVFIGGKMLFESSGGEKKISDPFSFKTLLPLAVATSIDAFAVGLSISMLGAPVLLPAAVIGAVTYSCSAAGVYAGSRCGHFLEGKAEAAGGLILIGIGVKILLEHTLWIK